MQFPRKRKSDELKKIDDGPIYLTQEALERLHEKLIRLKKSLPPLIAETQRTAAYGDRSDNAEYKEVKSTLRRTHRQILSTENQIKRAMIIKTGPDNSGTVRIGSIVTIEAGENKKTYQILGSFETNPNQGVISNESPLGKNMIGKKTGESFSIQTKNGNQEYRIISIE